MAISKTHAAAWLGGLVLCATSLAAADETCNSPYIGNLIKGQEDYLYVWALGEKGLGDGSDKLVTIDAKPGSAKYGKVTRDRKSTRLNSSHSQISNAASCLE